MPSQLQRFVGRLPLSPPVRRGIIRRRAVRYPGVLSRIAARFLATGVSPAFADNCASLHDCYSTAWTMIWALLGLIALLLLPLLIEGAIASALAGTALRALAATARVSRIARVLGGLGRPSGGQVAKSINKAADDIANWLGKDARMIKNDAGDRIFVSADGTKRVRFDINRPYPHENPHSHVEEIINGRWVKSGPIYPRDLPSR